MIRSSGLILPAALCLSYGVPQAHAQALTGYLQGILYNDSSYELKLNNYYNDQYNDWFGPYGVAGAPTPDVLAPVTGGAESYASWWDQEFFGFDWHYFVQYFVVEPGTNIAIQYCTINVDLNVYYDSEGNNSYACGDPGNVGDFVITAQGLGSGYTTWTVTDPANGLPAATLVPEPSTWALFGVGLAPLGWLRRHRRLQLAARARLLRK